MDSSKLSMSLFDNSSQPFCIIKVELDNEGAPYDWTFLYCNDALAKLERYPKDKLIGQRFFELFPDGDRKWLGPYYEAAYENKTISFDSVSDEVGRYLYVECFPLDEVGVCGCMLRTTDQQIEYRKQITTNNSVSNMLHTAVTTGLWRIEYNEFGEQTHCIWSEAFCRILGYDSKDDFPEALDSWFDKIHPDDIYFVKKKYNQAVYDYSGKKKYDIEYRMCNKQGEYHWFRDTAHISRRADGSPIATDGVVVLTDEKHQAEEIIRQTEKYNQTLLESAACGIVSYTLPNHSNLYLNAKAMQVLGFNDLEEAKLNLYERIADAVYISPNAMEMLDKMKTVDGSSDYECRILGAGGNIINLIVRSEVITNPKGERIAYTTFLDITENRELRAINDTLENQNSIIRGLSKEYTSVWFISNDGNSCLEFQNNGLDGISHELFELRDSVQEKSDYAEGIRLYMENFICEEDREAFAKKTSYEVVIEEIKKNTVYSVLYRRNYQGKKDYYQVNYTLTGNEENYDFVMGFKNVNEVVQSEVQKNEELERALVAAEQGNIAKMQFLSNMSHDIRTPMNGIIGMLSIIRKHEDDVERVRDCLSKIEMSSNLLLSLVNDVLDMSKLDSDSVVLKNETINLDEVCAEVTTAVSFQAEAVGIHVFEEHDDYTGVYVKTSPLHLKKILFNLYTNAIKYNKEEGSISTSMRTVSKTDDVIECEFKIKDTGIGMSKEYIENGLFKPFSQADNSVRSRYNGTGLGLSIVKRLVEMMHGTITVKSEEGQGSCFVVVLPFEIDHNHASFELHKQDEGDTDISGMKLLLVEDNELNMEIAKLLLEDEGVRITTAVNGEEALRRFEESEPEAFDVILMDIMMPVMDGLTATKKIRKLNRPDAATIPILAMTANAFAEDSKKCLEAGMNAHLVKPLNLEIIKKTLRKYRK